MVSPLEHAGEPGRARTVCLDGARLATLVPISDSFTWPAATFDPAGSHLLSRFAYSRREQGEMLLESPLSHARIVLHDWRAAALIHLLARPRRLEELRASLPSLPAPAAGELMRLLLGAQMLQRIEEDGSSPAEDGARQCWEFHDLLFHARSRRGRHDQKVGGTYRLAGQVEPPPVLKPASPVPTVDLYRPDLERLEKEDPPFAAVQEARRSIRQYGGAPISARQLGEFLYRVGRLADYMEDEVPTPHGPVRMAYAPRPYPSGGGLYELELYPVVQTCDGLASGLYHYDPEQHRLERQSDRTAGVEQLLQEAGWSSGIPSDQLQVLFVIAARFPRIAWKYESIAYSLTLKHVGVLYQTMYLAATAMGLAPCALGCGDADLFARTAGTDYFAETSVGEFLLGSQE